jgi:DNA-binding NarL/FixJ family response regulator
LGTSNFEDLVRAVHAVRVGDSFSSHPNARSPLTPRERIILQGVANGWEDKRIALKLGIEGAVVRNYVSSVMAKLRAAHADLTIESRVQLALYYWGVWSVLNAHLRTRMPPTYARQAA